MILPNKIQCPGCGATGSFEEKEPNHYRCDYCYTTFEHRSILPDKTTLQIFYEQAKDLYEKHKVLSPKRAQYYARMFNGIMQLEVCLRSLGKSKFYVPVFNNLKELIQREFQLLYEEDIHVGIKKEALYKDGNTLVRLKYLVFYYTILAQHSSRLAENHENLQEALTYIEHAEQLQNTLELGYETDIARSKVGILKRLYSEDKVFEYVAALTGFSIKGQEVSTDLEKQIEQAKVDFEAILLSESFEIFLAQKEN